MHEKKGKIKIAKSNVTLMKVCYYLCYFPWDKTQNMLKKCKNNEGVHLLFNKEVNQAEIVKLKKYKLKWWFMLGFMR